MIERADKPGITLRVLFSKLEIAILIKAELGFT